MKRSSLVRGQRVSLRGIPGQVVDAAGYLVVVELDDGRIEARGRGLGRHGRERRERGKKARRQGQKETFALPSDFP